MSSVCAICISRLLNFDDLTAPPFCFCSIIALNIGTCIAYFVIIGDLAPPIIAQATGVTLVSRTTKLYDCHVMILLIQSPEALRALVLILGALLIAFPLGLCRSVNSLSGISLCSLLFYALLTFQLLVLSYSHFSWEHLSRVTWWDNAGLLKCTPIFALAFACQT